MDKKYDHILNMPHPTSAARPRMSLSRRAAQFAPFAALTGFEAMIGETARQTEAAICLDEGEIATIDSCLRLLRDEIGLRPAVFLRFFCPDHRKEGGSFRCCRSRVVKMNETLQILMLENGEKIPFQHIVQLIRE